MLYLVKKEQCHLHQFLLHRMFFQCRLLYTNPQNRLYQSFQEPVEHNTSA